MRLQQGLDTASISQFQSTHSLRSATSAEVVGAVARPGFNPRTPCGVRLPVAGERGLNHSFNPRTPCGVRQEEIENNKHDKRFQSTHSLRSATVKHGLSVLEFMVSIHALLAECDSTLSCPLSMRRRFNPRTPCGVRPCAELKFFKWQRFQSTHSLRSATEEIENNKHDKRFQSTHSLRSATKIENDHLVMVIVSIHALLAECDHYSQGQKDKEIVSIHALLAECDSRSPHPIQQSPGFNPRTPCGVRLPQMKPRFVEGWFQSTHSLRSATRGRGTGAG